MKKRVLSLVVVLCMICAFGLVSASAVDEDEIVYNSTWDIYYSTFEEAFDEADDGDVFYLTSNYTLEDSLTIPEGVVLVVPTDATFSDSGTGNNASGSIQPGVAAYTMTIPSGKTLTVEGTLIVAGNQQSGGGTTGCLTGNYGKVVANGDISVADGGELYARGEIAGAGSVTASSGSSVYQLFQIYDWRGGSQSVAAVQNGVFPFSLYEFNNITATTYYNNGSSLISQFYVYAENNDITGQAIIIGQNGMLDFSANSVSTEYIRFTYGNGRITAGVYGDVESGAITVSAMGYTISSAGAILPFGYNLDPYVSANGSLTIGSGLKVLPGCSFDIDGDIIVNSSGELYFYGANYSSTYNYAGWSTTTPATLDVAGTLTNNGIVAASDTNTLIPVSSAPEDQITLYEYVQNSGTATNVTFYKMAAAA